MKFQSALIGGTLIKRYNRFLVNISLDSGENITAHCPNSGSLLGITLPGTRVWVEHDPKPNRKLSYTWHLAETDGTLVGINTQWPNHLLEEALQNRHVGPLSHYVSWKREVKYGAHTRFDFCLYGDEPAPCYLEVKSIHMKRRGRAEFPDSVTERGAKHLRELSQLAQTGAKCMLFYVIQRDDCQRIGLAEDIDPAYATAAQYAQDAGVEFLAYDCAIDFEGIRLRNPIPFGLGE